MKLLALSAAVLMTVSATVSPAAELRAIKGHFCPFCGAVQGQTLVKEVQSAKFVVYGLPSNPQIKRDADGRESSTTDLTIEEVIKPDPFLKDKKRLVLPRYIPPSPAGQEKLIVFCDVINDQADTYLYLTTKDGALVKYLKEAIKLDENDIPKRLRFYFDYLDHFDTEISGDAYKEYAKADYPDVVKMIKQHGDAGMRTRLRDWFKDPNTPLFRYGLIGLMLGLCGDKSDGEVFLGLLNDPDKSMASGVDGILAGYILVDKENGWKYTKQLVMNAANDFSKRYAGLRAIRFLVETHHGHITQEELLSTVAILLEQGDIVDLAIEDLRKWKQWQFTDKIMGVRHKESHLAPIVQRTVLKYALACPQDKYPSARQFVEEMKKTQPEKVKDALEILELEKSMAGPTEAEASKAK
jgi:hypothetical protein